MAIYIPVSVTTSKTIFEPFYDFLVFGNWINIYVRTNKKEKNVCDNLLFHANCPFHIIWNVNIFFVGNKIQISLTTRDLLNAFGGFVMEERRDDKMKVCIKHNDLINYLKHVLTFCMFDESKGVAKRAYIAIFT